MAKPIEKQIGKVVLDPKDSKPEQCSSDKESNPMVNKVILKTLFEHVPLQDLKTFRKVCKLWFEVSLTRWRSDAVVKLGDIGWVNQSTLELEQYLNLINGSSTSNGDFYQFGKAPYQKYKLYGWDLKADDAEVEVSRRQLEFWNKCGPQMTHLEIEQSVFHSRQEFESILFRSTPNLEVLILADNKYVKKAEKKRKGKGATSAEVDNMQTPVTGVKLRELKLAGSPSLGFSKVGNICSGRAEHNLPVTWAQFFGHFPNIKALTLTDIDKDGDDDQEFKAIFTALASLMKDPGVEWKIETLDVLRRDSMNLSVFDSGVCKRLNKLRLPLTTLSIDIGSETKGKTFKAILESYAMTLRKLFVYRNDLNEARVGYEEPFPFNVRLDELRELVLGGTAGCVNLNFLPFIPNLRKLAVVQDVGNSLLAAGSYVSNHETLELLYANQTGNSHAEYSESGSVSDTDWPKLKGFVCSYLEEFIYSARGARIWNSKKVLALSKLMPNLKTLMLGMRNDSFQVACQAWKDMEVLIVQPYGIKDFGLSGVLPKSQNRRPNITDLTRLQYFGMGHETTEARAYLTDESALQGLLRLGRLQDVTVTCSSGMTGKVFGKLATRFPHSKIVREKSKVGEWPLESEDSGDSRSWFNGDSDGNTSSCYWGYESDSDSDGDLEKMMFYAWFASQY